MSDERPTATREAVDMPAWPDDGQSQQDRMAPYVPPQEQPRRPQVVRDMPQDRNQAAPETVVIMAMSEQCDQIFGALAAAQGKYGEIERTLQAKVQSSRANYTYSYAPLDEVLQAVRPALSAEGIAILQFPRTRSSGNGNSSLVVRTMLAHKSGQWVYNELAASIVSPAPQDVGAGISYLRRYGLQSICGVAPGYDNDAPEPEPPVRPAERRSEQDQRRQEVPPPAKAAPAAKPAEEKPQASVAQRTEHVGKVKGVEERKSGDRDVVRVTLDDGAQGATADEALVNDIRNLAKVANATVRMVTMPAPSGKTPLVVSFALAAAK